MSEDVTAWADAIEAAIARERVSIVSRVRVLASTRSTQDAARRERGPGVMVLADRQTEGRGRMGRTWFQGRGGEAAGKGLAATFAIDRRDHAPLSIAAGIAACEACETGLTGRLGLKWPNDVVERSTERKLAGVLIEAAGDVSLVGVGINVGHAEADWPDGLRGRATSLREMGVERSRLDVAIALLVSLDRALALAEEPLLDRWRSRDILAGTERTFALSAGAMGGGSVRGRVLGIDPALSIMLADGSGEVRFLAAGTARLEASPAT